MQILAILFIGFSMFYVLILILTHFNKKDYEFRRNTHFMGILLLLALAGLQLSHFYYLEFGSPIINSPFYLILLFLVAPSFYFYSRPLLKAENRFKVIELLHFLSLFIVFVVSYRVAFVLAFIVGAIYLMWLLKTIYALRKFRDQFKSEIFMLSVVFLIAIGVSFLALTMPISQPLFFSLYAIAIGLALLIVALVLAYTPGISEDVSEIAKQTYAVSTILSIDCDAKLVQLNKLMNDDKLYQQSNLDLNTLSTELSLSSHQLSELINTNLGKNFSRYLRELRVVDAQDKLISQVSASVLSIGLEVGFSSQSNFYEAFKEIAGTTPGKFRKLNSARPRKKKPEKLF